MEEMMKRLLLALVLLQSSCKTRSDLSELRDIWLGFLNPRERGLSELSERNEYTRIWSRLPLEGQAQHQPWSDADYRSAQGGFAWRWQGQALAAAQRPPAPSALSASSVKLLSPIEKYDLLLTHTQWELWGEEEQRIQKDPRGEFGMERAAAAILFAEPTAVTVDRREDRSIPFGSSDTKALLIRFLELRSHTEHGVETRSLGGACPLDSDSYRTALHEGALEERDDQCYSVLAPAFHLALSNQLGLRRESFVIVTGENTALVHEPVLSYQSRILSESAEPDGARTLAIETEVQTVAAAQPSWSKERVIKKTAYRYSIELDSESEVKGGSWNGPAPRVIWMQNRPRFAADDFALESLYTLSASLPERLRVRDFSAIDSELQTFPLESGRPILSNVKYRIELRGSAPRGADGLKSFLDRAFQNIGPVSVYRNTFADEDQLVSVEVQFHRELTQAQLSEALAAHSQERVSLERILRP